MMHQFRKSLFIEKFQKCASEDRLADRLDSLRDEMRLQSK